MASIKISNLPALSSGTLTDDDQFVINDANQITSRLSYADFKTAFLTSNLTFAGSVKFSGDITITESVTSNVPTKGQVVAEVQTETDRALAAEAALGVRIDGVTNGVALLAAAENTFIGNLEVNGALTQGGSGVLTTATTADVVRTGSASTTMTGDFSVDQGLFMGGSIVATAANLQGAKDQVDANSLLIANNTTAVSAEVTRATEAEGVLTASVSAEVTRATEAEGVLTAAVAAENAAMLEAVAANKVFIDDLISRVEALEA